MNKPTTSTSTRCTASASPPIRLEAARVEHLRRLAAHAANPVVAAAVTAALFADAGQIDRAQDELLGSIAHFASLALPVEDEMLNAAASARDSLRRAGQAGGFVCACLALVAAVHRGVRPYEMGGLIGTLHTDS